MKQRALKAEEYLSEVRELRKKIGNLELRAEYLSNKVQGMRAIRYDKIKVQTSTTDYSSGIIAERDEILIRIMKKRKVLNKKIETRREQIKQLSKRVYRDVLTEMYLCDRDGRNMRMIDVADRLHYEYTYTSRMHSEALHEFELLFLT